MNILSPEKRKAVIATIVEGVGIRATKRLTGVSPPTILKIHREMGAACAKLHDKLVRGLKPGRIECDEVWAFVHCKQKRVARAKAAPPGAGDVWTWTAIDADTKLMISYLIGTRTPNDAAAFMLDVAGRITNLTQLTTDGLTMYPQAVYDAFGTAVDYAQLIKVYREDRQTEARYSPAECIGCKKQMVIGVPDPAKISTSIVERSNLTLRMQSRRFTRLTNGHSKKVEYHGYAVALFIAYYNFCRKHMSLSGRTPAMAAGLTDRVWSIDDLIAAAEIQN